MRLVDVYDYHGDPPALTVLYRLLAEREPEESISHKVMPTWEEHTKFVSSIPYRRWFIVQVSGQAVGAVYLSKANEIGIGILKAHRGNGHSKAAILELLRLFPGERVVANISPHNLVSIKLFESLGFKGPIQVTYER